VLVVARIRPRGKSHIKTKRQRRIKRRSLRRRKNR